MKSSSQKHKKKIPLPLARVRKELPPPAKAFKTKKRDDRKRTKEELSRALKESRFRQVPLPKSNGKGPQ